MSDPEDDRRRLETFFRDDLRRASVESPSFDELAAYVEDRLGPDARAALEEQLEADPALRLEVDDLRALRGAPLRRSPAVQWRRPLALAGLAAATALAFWVRTPERRRPVEPDAPTASASPIAGLKDGDPGQAIAADPELRQALGLAQQGVLPAPQGLDPLRSGPMILLGGPDRASLFGPARPLATRVSSDRPEFRWSAHPEALAYEVSVFDQDLQKRAGSGRLQATSWRPERALPRGKTYLWQISALTPGGRVTTPAPPAPEARFEIVDAATLAELERRRATAPDSRLVAALLLTRAGLLDDAEAELHALAVANPGSPQVRDLLTALRELRVVTPTAPATPPQ